MIRGLILTLPPNTKTLVHKATKPTTVVVRAPMSCVNIGDTTVTCETNGFRLKSQQAVALNLSTNDELYAICHGGCNLEVLVTA